MILTQLLPLPSGQNPRRTWSLPHKFLALLLKPKRAQQRRRPPDVWSAGDILNKEHVLRAAEKPLTGLEADEYRLGLKRYSPKIKDLFLDHIFERENVFCGCAPAIHQCQRVFAGDSNWAASITFVKS